MNPKTTHVHTVDYKGNPIILENVPVALVTEDGEVCVNVHDVVAAYVGYLEKKLEEMEGS